MFFKNMSTDVDQHIHVSAFFFLFFFTFCLAPGLVGVFARGRGGGHVERGDVLSKTVRRDELEVFEWYPVVELHER